MWREGWGTEREREREEKQEGGERGRKGREGGGRKREYGKH